ncbi:hypothetical protein KBB05_01840 [Patescibacteria group bacterium]|nr:hypothetical protein [Patescibacteria group bacterium]
MKSTVSLKRKWFGNYTDGQDTHLFSDLTDHWSGSRTSSSSHTSSDKQHIGTSQHSFDILSRLLSCFSSYLRICSCS